MLDDKTDIQQEQIIALYSGKWLRATGEIANVFRNGGYNNDRVSVVLYMPPRQNYRFPFIQVISFDAQWLDRVEVLPIGQKIAVLRQIEGASNHSPRLNHCEREAIQETTAKKK